MTDAAPAHHATVLVVGHTVLDHRFWADTFPPTSGRTPVSRYRMDLGGPAAVASLTIQTMEGHAQLVSRIGADETGHQVIHHLRDAGIDTTLVQRVERATTAVSAVIIGSDGSRSIFHYAGDNLPTDCQDSVEVHLDGVDAVLADSRWASCAHAYATAARQRGLPVIVDLDIDQSPMWEVARKATHVICDEDLATTLGGPSALLAQLDELGVWGAVTLGAQGVVARSGKVPAFHVEAIDSTGAGDVFHGAFALRIAEGASPEAALRFATAAGAEKCRLGRVPTRADVTRLLRR